MLVNFWRQFLDIEKQEEIAKKLFIELVNEYNKIQFKRNKLEIYYSSYGYIKLVEIDENYISPYLKFIQFKASNDKMNCLKGTIYFTNIRNEINIKIKSFFNDREIYTLENIDILSPLNNAIEKLFDQEKDDNNISKNLNNSEYLTAKSQYRIFSCHKTIHELNILLTIYENEIQDNELLLYLPIKDLSFSYFMKGKSIQLDYTGKIASKIDEDDNQYILGNIYYLFGRHYFEINLLTEPFGQSVIIGVATKKDTNKKTIDDVNNFYGLNISNMELITTEAGKTSKKEYETKETFSINDIVGVLLEFKKEGLELSYFKNEISLGIAFSNIKKRDIYPALSLGIVGTKVQITNQIDFPYFL